MATQQQIQKGEPLNTYDQLVQFGALLQKAITELGNKRTWEGTLEDALDAYNGLMEKSQQTLAESWAGQAERLMKDGWHGTGNCSFNLHPEHGDAETILADPDGPQVLLNAIKNQTYGMSLVGV